MAISECASSAVEDIPLKRLNVIPWAAHCVACQERLDREGSLDEPDLRLVA